MPFQKQAISFNRGLNSLLSAELIDDNAVSDVFNMSFTDAGQLTPRFGAINIFGNANKEVRGMHYYYHAGYDKHFLVYAREAAGNMQIHAYNLVAGSDTDITGGLTPPAGRRYRFASGVGNAGAAANRGPMLLGCSSTSAAADAASIPFEWNGNTAGNIAAAGTGVGGTKYNDFSAVASNFLANDIEIFKNRVWTVCGNITSGYINNVLWSYYGQANWLKDTTAAMANNMPITDAEGELTAVKGNGKELFFFKRNAVYKLTYSTPVYQTGTTPTDLTIDARAFGWEVVARNIGAVSKDTIQVVGNEVFFLSERGVISLDKLIQSGGNWIQAVISNDIKELDLALKPRDRSVVVGNYSSGVTYKGEYVLNIKDTVTTDSAGNTLDKIAWVCKPSTDGTYAWSKWTGAAVGNCYATGPNFSFGDFTYSLFIGRGNVTNETNMQVFGMLAHNPANYPADSAKFAYLDSHDDASATKFIAVPRSWKSKAFSFGEAINKKLLNQIVLDFTNLSTRFVGASYVFHANELRNGTLNINAYDLISDNTDDTVINLVADDTVANPYFTRVLLRQPLIGSKAAGRFLQLHFVLDNSFVAGSPTAVYENGFLLNACIFYYKQMRDTGF